MAYNCGIDFKYYYPATYQTPNTYVTQCDPQSYDYSYYYNAYQNQLRKLQNREVTMEYWTRQLQYFRNLLKNFSAEIETPEDLKKLLATCNIDTNSKKCFEKRRTFFNIDKNFGKCCCDSCVENALLQLCNALSVPSPCNHCNCSTCRSRCKKPCCAKYTSSYANQNSPGYCYIPWQTPANSYYYYYYYPNKTQTPPSYCQTRPQQFNNNGNNNFCPPNCEMCCNKCKFKNILNQINYVLSSAEQLKSVPCANACTCACNMPCGKSCCSIKEIKEETVTIKRESVAENYTLKSARKSIDKTAPSPDLAKLEYSETLRKKTETENIPTPPETSYEHSYHCVECRKDTPCRVTCESCECEPMLQKHPQQSSIRKSRKHLSESTNKYHSEDETIDDASNLSEEYKNYETCVKKQASIVLGEEYVSPSGTFEVLIQDQHSKCCCCKPKKKHNKQNNSNLMFHVDYTTYTKPKCDCCK